MAVTGMFHTTLLLSREMDLRKINKFRKQNENQFIIQFQLLFIAGLLRWICPHFRTRIASMSSKLTERHIRKQYPSTYHQVGYLYLTGRLTRYKYYDI